MKKETISLNNKAIKQLLSNKATKICTTLSYIEHFFILAYTITEYISISTFDSVLCIPIGFIVSPIELKVWAIAARIKKYKAIFKKKKKWAWWNSIVSNI